MAIESFYMSVALTEYEKEQIRSEALFEKHKTNDDLIYKKIIYIDNINNQEGCCWHLNACYCNFFDSCSVLYELCLIMDKVKPKFNFTVFNQKESIFDFTLMGFVQHVYEIVKPYKDNFNNMFGKLSVLPGKGYYTFKRKNKRFFIQENKI